jgi:hypothetical protein
MLCLLLVGRKKKKEKKRNGDGEGLFSPMAGHTLLAVFCEIFVAVMGAIKG